MFLQLMAGWVTAQVYHVGDLFTAEDGSQGIVFYLFPDGSGWAVALHDNTSTMWLSNNDDDIPNLPNYTSFQELMQDTAGYTNTQIIRAFAGAGAQCAANVVDFEHGWYLPSVAQLFMLHAQMPLIGPSLVAAGGDLMSGHRYESSNERSAGYHWCVSFANMSAVSSNTGQIVMDENYWSWSGGTYPNPFRAVRSFPPPENIYDTTLTYNWNTGSTEPHFSDVPLQTTNYIVTVSNAYGCTNSASVAVAVISNEPQTYYDTICQGATYNNYGFVLTAEETAGILDTTLTQTVSAVGCESEITVYLTLFPPDVMEIEEHAGQNFVWNGVTYTEEGTYTQYFNNRFGCDSTVILTLTLDGIEPDTVTVEETDPNVLYLPNAFTPNDDSRNTIFLPVFTNPAEIEEYRMEIYNRWGGLVFRTEEPTFGWDGANAMEGVYAVLVQYKFRHGKPKTVKGSVTLIR